MPKNLEPYPEAGVFDQIFFQGNDGACSDSDGIFNSATIKIILDMIESHSIRDFDPDSVNWALQETFPL